MARPWLWRWWLRSSRWPKMLWWRPREIWKTLSLLGTSEHIIYYTYIIHITHIYIYILYTHHIHHIHHIHTIIYLLQSRLSTITSPTDESSDNCNYSASLRKAERTGLVEVAGALSAAVLKVLNVLGIKSSMSNGKCGSIFGYPASPVLTDFHHHSLTWHFAEYAKFHWIRLFQKMSLWSGCQATHRVCRWQLLLVAIEKQADRNH